jgi:hypothetical protein
MDAFGSEKIRRARDEAGFRKMARRSAVPAIALGQARL